MEGPMYIIGGISTPDEDITFRLPAKSWCSNIEAGALRQLANLANHPDAFHHIALMPDAHQGYGMPIGGVAAFKGVVVPNAVGVDIGCGMCAAHFASYALAHDRKDLMGRIRKIIPVGFAHHQ